MISTGTFSVKAWATPGKAFSMPGPPGRRRHCAGRKDARIAVRDADADALLPAQDGADVELGAGLDQRLRIAGEEFGTLALENFATMAAPFMGRVPFWITGGVRAIR